MLPFVVTAEQKTRYIHMLLQFIQVVPLLAEFLLQRVQSDSFSLVISIKTDCRKPWIL